MALRLLVIEDRASDFELIEQHLKRNDLPAHCHQVDSNEALLAALQNHAWDVVLMDYNVPGMGFAATLSTLRAHLPDLPIILVSGYMGEDQAAELLKAGVSDFVLKYRLARLVPAIRRTAADAQEHSARRAAERALRESEERLRLAMEGAELGTVRYDYATDRIYLDARAREQFELGEQIERQQLYQRIHPDDRRHMEEVLAKAAEPGGNGRYAFEFRLLLGSERLRWLSSSGRVHFEGEGAAARPVVQIGITQDITQRKQTEEALRASEEHLQAVLREVQAHKGELEKQVAERTRQLRQQTDYLRALIDNFPFRVWLKDTGGRFLAINRAHASMYGRSPLEIVGKTDLDLAPEDVARGRIERDQEVMRTRQPASRETHLTGPDRNGWFETYKAPVVDSEGNVLGTIGYSRDITERKTAEDAREQALSEARRLADLRSEFVANMSHEIRTPLNAVLGLAQIGMRENAGRKARDSFARILESGQLLLGIVNDILDFSKIEAGKLKLEQVAFDPRQAIDRAIAQTAGAAYAKGLKLELHEAPDLPATCLGDVLRVSQVLVNLLSNAVKFTERGTVSLRAACDRGELVLRVKDTGLGMSAEQAQRLFLPFEQADGSTTRRFGGTGLGLAILRSLVDMMQGRIRVDSAPNAGSCFEVRLPLRGASPPLSLAGRRFVFIGLPPAEASATLETVQALGAEAVALTTASASMPPADLLVFNGASMDTEALRIADDAIAAGRRVAFVRTPGESDIPLGLVRARVSIVERPLRVRRLLEASSSPIEATADTPSGLRRLDGIRILAAEDNEVNRLVLQDVLETEGARLVVVSNGRLLLERMLRDGPAAYDIVLTDIQMPQMDGYQAAYELRALAPDLPIIGLTARAMAEERDRCLAAGMSEHIAKPIDIDRLVAVILRHCRRAQAPDQVPARAGAPRTAQSAAPAAGGDSPPIDWAALKARYSGKPALVQKLLAITATSYADTPAALREASRKRDLEALAFIAHGLKGVAGNIAAPALHEQAQRTEECARQGSADAPACGERLALTMEELLAALSAQASDVTHSHH